MAPWGICCVAAATPDSWDISIEDEMMDEIVWDDQPDLVGISIIAAASSSRAYEIGDYFRNKGIPVVMGGIHASAMPEEALKHSDAVLIGEVEGDGWTNVLNDCVNKKLKGIYRNTKPHDLKGLPFPRLDLLKHKSEYDIYQYVQPARGCMYKCDFCSTTAFWGKFRKRPVDEVIEDIKRLDPNKPIMVMDEFVGCDREYYMELMRKMIPLKLKWWSCQTGVKVAEDKEMMDLFQKSGCKYVFLGLESPNQESLSENHKKHNVGVKYIDVIKGFHDRGIIIQGGFVFGLDGDDPGTFNRVWDFIKKSEIDMVQFNIVYPYPGVPLRKSLQEQGRITSDDFDNYIFDGINIIPKSMTQEELNAGYNWILKKSSSWTRLIGVALKRTFRGEVKLAIMGLMCNKGTRRSYLAIKHNGGKKSIRYPQKQ